MKENEAETEMNSEKWWGGGDEPQDQKAPILLRIYRSVQKSQEGP